jgi:DNA-binding XRE family transcriptional regulator
MAETQTREHPLKAYRREHGLTARQFAESVSTTVSTISRIEADQLPPSVELAMRIQRETRGAVTAVALLGVSACPHCGGDLAAVSSEAA